MRDFTRDIRRRLAPLNLPPAREREIAEELSQHLRDRYDELRAAGASDADASRDALSQLASLARQLAGIDSPAGHEVPSLGSRGGNMIGSLWQDIHYSARTFAKSPGFTAVVVLTLALGIGATTAIFSVLDAVMLRSFPYPDIDRIMILSETTRAGQGLSVAWANFQDWRDQNEVFEHFGIYRGMTVNLTGGDQPQRLSGSMASAEVFKALGIQAEAGRTFLAEEDRAATDRVAIVSDRLWRSRFDADPALVGQPIVLNGQTHTIVGIAPPGMRFPSRLTDVWLPLGLFVRTLPPDRGTHPNLTVIGKLKAGVSVEQANTNMDAIARRLEKQYPMSNTDHTVSIAPYYEQIVRNIRPALLTLIGAVTFVLLIACANLANLMLARADQRQREMAIRAALGADRRRIVQQVLTENILMSLAGGSLGALLAAWAIKALVAARPASIPRVDLVSVDVRVLAFTAAVSILTGLAFGLAPALRAASQDLLTPLKDAARSSSGRAGRFRSALVVVEVGLALVLLIGAALTIRSFGRLMAIELGFNPQRVVTMRVTLPPAKYPNLGQWMVFHDELLRRVGTLPAIEAVGLNSAVPLEGGGSESEVVYEGQPPPKSVREKGTMCLFQASSPNYFRAMGIPLLKGRPFTDRDTADSTLVAVVDDTLVRKLFPGADPIGKRIAFEFRGTGPADPRPIWREIVGVVRHVRHYGLTGEPPFVQVYAPLQQIPLWFQGPTRPSMALIARTALEPERLAASIRHEVAAIDRDIPVYGVRTMEDYLAQNTEQPRLSVMLLGAFGALALVLAIVGIYGVLSYLVTLRTQEIGIRLALGATRGDVLRLIVGRGMMLTAIGLAMGLAGSWAITASLSTLLFGISPHDAPTFASITTLLAVVAFLASYLPGHRATRVDPVITLRAE